MPYTPQLTALIRSVRPALKAQPTTEAERAKFVYDLVREVYDHAKFDLHAPTEDTEERARLADVLNAALPPIQLGEQETVECRSLGRG